MKPKIFYTKPSITELEINYATDAAKNGWGEKCYEYIDKFESKFKEYTGAKYAIATSSCTGALHMGLSALGVGLGDEVILADTNWIASAAPITYLGAKPIFVDILTDTWCLDPEKVEAAITPKTKAIIAVHLYGNLCEMDKLMAIGEKYGIPVIEDAAEAIGSFWTDKHAGTMGKFGVFSFHGTKTLTTGEGGMFVTNDAEFYEHVLTLSNHGRSRNQLKQFWPDMIGFKYKISNIQAAIGCAQIERIEELTKKKHEILSAYRNNLLDIPGLKMNPEPKDGQNGAWMPTAVFDSKSTITRKILQDAFAEENIDARVFFWPLSSMSIFNSIKSNTISWSISNRAINLPSYHEISSSEIERVSAVISRLTK
jgi:perosamine synthetase